MYVAGSTISREIAFQRGQFFLQEKRTIQTIEADHKPAGHQLTRSANGKEVSGDSRFLRKQALCSAEVMGWPPQVHRMAVRTVPVLCWFPAGWGNISWKNISMTRAHSANFIVCLPHETEHFEKQKRYRASIKTTSENLSPKSLLQRTG